MYKALVNPVMYRLLAAVKESAAGCRSGGYCRSYHVVAFPDGIPYLTSKLPLLPPGTLSHSLTSYAIISYSKSSLRQLRSSDYRVTELQCA